MNFLKTIVAGLLLVALGYGFGRYAVPAKVEEQKQVDVQKSDNINKDVIVVKHEVKRPDGTIIIDTTTQDKSTIVKNTNSEETDTKITTNAKPQWSIGAMAGVKYDTLAQPNYTVNIERRIIGPIFAGVYGRTDKEFGLAVHFEF